MKRLLATSTLLLLLSSQTWANPSKAKGCIAVFQGTIPISIEVELPAFTEGLFATDLFRFANLPKNMVPDDQERYCYAMNDERFAFVHVFYYAVNEINDYKNIFNKLGLTMQESGKWEIFKKTSMPSGGNYTHNGVTQIHYPDLAIPDPGTIQHEVGHLVQASAAGNDKEHGGPLDEGLANLLALLHSGNSIIGGSDFYSGAYDINTFVRFPDHIMTFVDGWKSLAQDPVLTVKYPEFITDVKQLIASGIIDPTLPDYYTSSAAFNQPLWEASIRYGVEPIKILAIKTVAILNEKHDYTYSEVANTFIINAQSINPELAAFLKEEFAVRGVLNANLKISTNKKVKEKMLEIGLWK